MALMPPKDIHNPKRWRDRAAEIRALAESATDAETRHNVIHLADGWGLALAQCIWASGVEGASFRRSDTAPPQLAFGHLLFGAQICQRTNQIRVVPYGLLITEHTGPAGLAHPPV